MTTLTNHRSPARDRTGLRRPLCRLPYAAFLLLPLVLSASAHAQPSPCADAPGARQLDFWLGRWELRWGEDGRGTNTVQRILDGCIIEERFRGTLPGGLLVGRSHSAYDADAGTWRQTWVDNQGAYLDFTGGMQPDGRMILSRTDTRGDAPVEQRMVFYNIEPDALDWRWERSGDGGRTWEVLWTIHYERRAEG